MTFERNDGQVSSQYRYVSRHQGIQTLFSAEGADFVISSGARLQMRFQSAQTAPVISGEHLLAGRANYLRGAQREHWITAIPTYDQLRYTNLYPGIDLVFHADAAGSQLEHDFLLAPGADPNAIRLEMQGADAVKLQADGQLTIAVKGKSLTFQPPAAWQETTAGRVPVAAHFRVDAHRVVTFHLAEYDHTRPLTIDPVLSFSTYLDGTGYDLVHATATDAGGNIYAAGVTGSSDFPVNNAEQATIHGLQDAFICKLDPTGHTLLYSTYLGGSSNDEAESVAVDTNGNVVVSGTSLSHDFPQAGPLTNTVSGYTETFVASLNTAGTTLRYSGFLAAGESFSLDNFSKLSRVALDAQGNAYVAGLTDDPNFTLSAGAYGGPVAPYPASGTLFLVKVQPDGSIGYKADIPPTSPQPVGSSLVPLSIGNLAVDSTGAVVLAGTAGTGLPTTSGTLSPSFPNSEAPIDAVAGYVLKVNPVGSALVFATYLPGTDNVSDVALDASGNIFLAGRTYESTLPTSAAALQKTLIPRGVFSSFDAGFVFKLSGDGTTAMGATYLEGTTPQGSGGTDILGLALDTAGNVSVAGSTGAADLPLKSPLQSFSSGSASDLFLAQLSGDLSTLRFGTFLHPSDGSAAFAGLTALPNGHILLAASTDSTLFHTTAGSLQPTPPPPASPQVFYPRIILAAVDLSVAAPALCFDNPRPNLGSVLVGTVANIPVNVTNCGTAPLTLTGVTSSEPTVTATQNCNSIAPAGVCQVQLAYAPTAAGNVLGLLTLSGNNPISPQVLTFTGTAGYPQVDIPPSITFGYLLVGQTGSVNGVGLVNNGVGPFILTSATVTGDFQITGNTCTAPVPYHSVCGITINFSPTAAGSRTGVLTLTDNLSPAVQTIQLNGDGLTSAPAPTITTVYAVPAGASGTGALAVYGTGFFPNSTVLWNGQPRTTHYSGFRTVTADLSAADTQLVGEAEVAVTTPLPGGGTSASVTATVYGRLQNIETVHEVFEPHSQLIYATVSKTSPNNANSVVAIDPVAMTVVKTLLTGNKPDAIAVSDDGSLLYVGLDDLFSVTQIALPAGTQNFVVAMPNVNPDSIPATTYSNLYASALKVVPGQPHAWVAGLCQSTGTPCGVGVVAFDDAAVRPIQPIPNITAANLVFANDPTVVYSTQFDQIPPSISSYKISANGVQLTTTVDDVGGSPLLSDGSSLYDNTGEVIDPSTLTTQFKYPQGNSTFPPTAGGFTLDTANHRLYFAGLGSYNYETSAYGGLLLSAVGQTSKATIGQIQFPELVTAAGIERFGANGLAINQGTQWLFVQTHLTQATAATPSLAVAPAELSFGSQLQGTASAKQTVTVTNPGTVAVPITGIAAGGDYTETDTCGASLAASAACTIQVTFSPSALGDRTAQLTIAFNGLGSPGVVNLDGTGTVPAPAAALSPSSLTYAGQPLGTTSAAQTVMLTNSGTAALLISGISVTGDYSQTNTCGTSLAVSASCAISVSFTPSAAGDRTGQLKIADNAPGTPQAVSLDGTGAAAAPPITLAPQGSGSSTATATAGGTASYNLTVAATTYTGVVQLSCAGVPSPATCSINPAAPVVTAGTPAVFVVTVNTAAATTAVAPGQQRVSAAGVGLAILFLSPLLFSLKKHRSAFVALTVLGCAIIFGLAGCGSGSPSTPVVGPKTLAPGTYQLTITAVAGNETATELLTLTVK